MTKIIQWYDPQFDRWSEGVVLAYTAGGDAVIEHYKNNVPAGVVVVPDAVIKEIQNETME